MLLFVQIAEKGSGYGGNARHLAAGNHSRGKAGGTGPIPKILRTTMFRVLQVEALTLAAAGGR